MAAPVLETRRPNTEARVSNGASPCTGVGSQPAMGVCVTPPAAEHASTVQTLPSATRSGTPAAHVPSRQLSLPLQTVSSRQSVPSGRGGCVNARAASSHTEVVHALGFGSVGGGPATQAPAAHAARPLQNVPPHEVPLVTGTCVQPLGPHRSSVQGCPSSHWPGAQLPESAGGLASIADPSAARASTAAAASLAPPPSALAHGSASSSARRTVVGVL